jgi:hypothetical protein
MKYRWSTQQTACNVNECTVDRCPFKARRNQTVKKGKCGDHRKDKILMFRHGRVGADRIKLETHDVSYTLDLHVATPLENGEGERR